MSGRALIICVSVSHGNTAAVAHVMGDALDAEVLEPEQVDPATLADYDLIGFGSGIFGASHHRRLRLFVERLPRAQGGRAFVFNTSGWGRDQHRPWEQSLSALLESKGYDVVGSFACRGYDTWSPLRLVGGINKGHPNARDLSHALVFAQRLSADRSARRPRRAAG